MKKIKITKISLALVAFTFIFQSSNGQFNNTGTNNLSTLPDKNNVGIGIDGNNIARRLHIYKEHPATPPGSFIGVSSGLRLELGFIDASPASIWDLATNGSGFHIRETIQDQTFFYIDNSGFTGIGTTTPQGRLDVNSAQSGNYNDALFVKGHPTIPRLGGIIHHQGSNYAFQEVAQITSSPTAGKLVYHYVNRFSPGEAPLKTNVLVMQGDGKVGINNGSPQYNLDVEGDARITDLDVCNKVRAEEVEVLLSTWCDYVFDDEYALRSLTEVESYIEENHHLPEIPSTEEVMENGVNLGEMNALLLKKIEELTLYLIDQNKRIAELEKAAQN